MNGTETGTVRRPWDQVEYTLGQIAKYNIPIEQICRAVKRENRAAVRQYLAGESPSGNWRIDCVILSIIQDIVDARRSEQRQVEEPRELHCAPRHPGIRGRECCVLTWSREQFLDLVRLSQPGLVDGLYNELLKAYDDPKQPDEPVTEF